MPLELQLYFSSYVSLLQRRKTLDVPTISQLLGAIHDLQETLTGLEKIVTVGPLAR
jgi:putative membrane protein